MCIRDRNKSARATQKNYDKIQIFKTNYMYMNINNVYYIETSVLLENIPPVKFIKTTSGTRVVYFP